MSKPDAAAEAAEPIEGEDLDLISPALEDEGKDDAEIWNEIDAEEAAASGDATTDDTDTDAAADKAAADEGDADEDADADAAAATAAGPAKDQGKTGDEAAPDKKEQKPEAAATPAAAVDWSKAPPELRAEYEKLQSDKAKLEQSERSNRGRVSALQRQIDGFQRGSGKSAKDGKPKALQSEKGKKLREEYPEVAEPIAEELEALRSEVSDMRASEIERVRDDHIAEQTGLLEAKHSDWENVAADKRFGVVPNAEGKPSIASGSWLATQPRHIREAALRNALGIEDHEEAADVIGRFKEAHPAARQETPPPNGSTGKDTGTGKGQDTKTGSLSDRRRRQLEASQSARGRGPGVASGIPEDGDEQAIWAAFDEQERRAAGRA